MARSVANEQEASGGEPAALNRRVVLGALSLGFVAAACNTPGSKKSASGTPGDKPVGDGGGDEVQVGLPSPEKEVEEDPTPKETVPGVGEEKPAEGGGNGNDGGMGAVPDPGQKKKDADKGDADADKDEGEDKDDADADKDEGEDKDDADADEGEDKDEDKDDADPDEDEEKVVENPADEDEEDEEEEEGGPLSPGTGVDALRVANRITFGVTPAVREAIGDTPSEFINAQLDLTESDAATEEMLAGFSTIAGNARERHAAAAAGDEQSLARIELTHANVLRARYSANQLYEVMCQVWMDHFNMDMEGEVEVVDEESGELTFKYGSLVAGYQEEAIRPHAMGNFAEMLRATAQHPAMLAYLDGAYSRDDGAEDFRESSVNENYGREILELHTLGTNEIAYREGDVTFDKDDIDYVSVAFAGWTFDKDKDSPTFLEFEFDETAHVEREISLLEGEFVKDGTVGKETADEIITFLANHPVTARHIAYKLLVRFVDDEVSESLVDSTAEVFMENDTDIIPTLVHIFNSDEFANSDGEKLRRPFENMVATLRACGADVPNDPNSAAAKALHEKLASLNHEPWGHDTPDGYPDRASQWLSGPFVLDRCNTSAYLATGRMPGAEEVVPSVETLRGVAETAGALVASLAPQIGLGPIPEETQAIVLNAVGLNAGDAVADEQVQDIASLLFAHPLFTIR